MRLVSRIFDTILSPGPAAFAFLIGGLVVFFGGFIVTDEGLDWSDTGLVVRTVIADAYSNLGIELVSIAATVLVIDRLSQRRSNRERLQELIAQMRSKDNGLALAAVELMRLHGWLVEGSLIGANLEGATLPDRTKWTPETDLGQFTNPPPKSSTEG